MEPVIQVHHGVVPIFVRDLGKCLMVMGVLDLPAEVTERLEQLTPAERQRFLLGLEEILTACPRIGFSVDPKGATDVAAIRRVVLDQTLQVAENDAASFNRFSDAIQETETILLRANAFVGGFLPSLEMSPRYSSTGPPPSELYL